MSNATRSQSLAKRRRSAAEAFASWLSAAPSRDELRSEALVTLIRRSGIAISWSSAYRVARRLGVRGKYRNRSRYDGFWAVVNWRLPDGTLSEVWGTLRGNLRQRRLRMNAGPPRWRAYHDADDADFRHAVLVERRKAARFRGPRPR